MTAEACENCGRTIGNLEPAHVCDGHVVCTECLARLAPQAIPYAMPATGRDADPVTVQLTARRWKAIQLAGFLVAMVGFVLLPVATSTNSRDLAVVALWVAALGAVGVVVGWALGWWFHG